MSQENSLTEMSDNEITGNTESDISSSSHQEVTVNDPQSDKADENLELELSGSELDNTENLQPKVTRNRPEVSKKPTKKMAGKSGKKTSKRQKNNQFSTYIYQVLKEVHPELGLSSTSMNVLNSFVIDIMDRLATEASYLVKRGKTQTLTSRDIQAAVKLILPGELAKHAECEAKKALAKFDISKEKEKTAKRNFK